MDNNKTEEVKKNITVYDVAKYILKKVEYISTYKLHKLLYYCQAWSLVFEEEPLFYENFYAWANGAICKSLYNYHKGHFSISDSELSIGDPSKLSKKQKETIDMVLKSYNKFSGQELSDIIHTERPWIIARGTLGIGERGESEISLEIMAEYYSDLYFKQKTFKKKKKYLKKIEGNKMKK